MSLFCENPSKITLFITLTLFVFDFTNYHKSQLCMHLLSLLMFPLNSISFFLNSSIIIIVFFCNSKLVGLPWQGQSWDFENYKRLKKKFKFGSFIFFFNKFKGFLYVNFFKNFEGLRWIFHPVWCRTGPDQDFFDQPHMKLASCSLAL